MIEMPQDPVTGIGNLAGRTGEVRRVVPALRDPQTRSAP